MATGKKKQGESGFILATAILAMVVLGAAVTGGYFVASQEYRVGKATRKATSAFYASQSGLQREFATWPIRTRWTMKGGQTLNIGPYPLPNGAVVRGTVTRIDNTPEVDGNTERYYLIQVTGAAPAPAVGEEVRSIQAMLLRVRYYDFCCTAAVTAKDTFTQAGNSQIDGGNATPLAWAGQCDSTSTAPPTSGAEIQCSTCYSSSGAIDTVMGNPPVEVDTTLKTQSLTEWDEVSFDFLKAKATKVYPDGATVTAVAPALTVDPMTGLPICNKTVQSNWGAPTNPLHACFTYMPIIYAQGSITIGGGATPPTGQGILLVEGDLSMTGRFEFYGIIIVKGHVRTTGTGNKIVGGLVVAGQNTGNLTESFLGGDATVSYSACSVSRAKQFADLAKKEPLALRSWSEALN